MQFRLDPDVAADTPDGFRKAARRTTAFGVRPAADAARMFTSEGTFVDPNGDLLERDGRSCRFRTERTAPRAITVMGATALIRVVAMERQRVGGVDVMANETEPTVGGDEAGFSLDRDDDCDGDPGDRDC